MAIEVLVASYIYKHVKLMCALTALTENKNFFSYRISTERND